MPEPVRNDYKRLKCNIGTPRPGSLLNINKSYTFSFFDIKSSYSLGSRKIIDHDTSLFSSISDK